MSTAKAVQHLLYNIPLRYASVSYCAERLHCAPSTLIRRLAKENTSFNRILSEVRMARVLESLTNGREPTTVIANRVGFSQVNSFYAWYKNYNGEPWVNRVRGMKIRKIEGSLE